MEIRITNPATEEILSRYQTMEAGEVYAIAGASHRAFVQWRQMTVAERAPYFVQLAGVLRKYREDWARLITLEMGKTIAESRAEVEKCAWMSEVYAQNAEAWLADEEVEADGLKHRVVYQPLGVILSIMPWNYPFWQALRFAVPGLLAGNTSLLKHASNVTGCALAIEESFRLAGFPENVFRTIVPDYETVGDLIGADVIQGVSLTGSAEVGRHIAAAAGRALKKVVLELGGSDPFIVLDDVDLDFTVQGAVAGRMVAAGQSCIASKRFLVHESVAEEFAALFADRMGQLVTGDPLNEATQVGAIVNESALVELEGQLADAVERGAKILCGGRRREGTGFFFEPTVVMGVTPEMRLAREEVFGPIAPILAVPDDDAAVALANASEFGLGGSVWTRNLERGESIARRVESGTLFVNSFTKSDPRMPFGGIKNSGLGRELSHFGLREFTNIKGLNVYKHG